MNNPIKLESINNLLEVLKSGVTTSLFDEIASESSPLSRDEEFAKSILACLNPINFINVDKFVGQNADSLIARIEYIRNNETVQDRLFDIVYLSCLYLWSEINIPDVSIRGLDISLTNLIFAIRHSPEILVERLLPFIKVVYIYHSERFERQTFVLDGLFCIITMCYNCLINSAIDQHFVVCQKYERETTA